MNPIELACNSIIIQAETLKTLKHNLINKSDVYNQILDVLRTPGLSNYESRIIITGIGKNSNIATKASETFASLGIPSMYLNTAHYSHGDAGFIGPKDVIIHISRSGKTQELLHTANHLRKIRPEVKQVLLHCNESLSSDILELFDFDFCTGNVEESDKNNLAPTTSTTVLLALVDTFAINLSSERQFTPEDFLRFHPGGTLGKQLSNSVK